MRKALKIISISAGLVSVISAAVLGYIYLGDIIRCLKKMIKSFSVNIPQNKTHFLRSAFCFGNTSI